jgi:hypothetical protein
MQNRFIIIDDLPHGEAMHRRDGCGAERPARRSPRWTVPPLIPGRCVDATAGHGSVYQD